MLYVEFSSNSTQHDVRGKKPQSELFAKTVTKKPKGNTDGARKKEALMCFRGIETGDDS